MLLYNLSKSSRQYFPRLDSQLPTRLVCVQPRISFFPCFMSRNVQTLAFIDKPLLDSLLNRLLFMYTQYAFDKNIESSSYPFPFLPEDKNVPCAFFGLILLPFPRKKKPHQRP